MFWSSVYKRRCENIAGYNLVYRVNKVFLTVLKFLDSCLEIVWPIVPRRFQKVGQWLLLWDLGIQQLTSLAQVWRLFPKEWWSLEDRENLDKSQWSWDMDEREKKCSLTQLFDHIFQNRKSKRTSYHRGFLRTSKTKEILGQKVSFWAWKKIFTFQKHQTLYLLISKLLCR